MKHHIFKTKILWLYSCFTLTFLQTPSQVPQASPMLEHIKQQL